MTLRIFNPNMRALDERQSRGFSHEFFQWLRSFIDAITANTPPGSIMEYAKPNATAPAGWLRCDGSAVSRTTYAALFAVCGTSYGVGDGSTTFNLPSADATAFTTLVKT